MYIYTCFFIYMHIYMYIYIYVFSNTHTRTPVGVHARYLFSYICTYISIHTHMRFHTHVYIHTCISIYMHIYMYIYTYAFSYTCTYTHMYFQTHTHGHRFVGTQAESIMDLLSKIIKRPPGAAPMHDSPLISRVLRRHDREAQRRAGGGDSVHELAVVHAHYSLHRFHRLVGYHYVPSAPPQSCVVREHIL